MATWKFLFLHFVKNFCQNLRLSPRKAIWVSRPPAWLIVPVFLRDIWYIRTPRCPVISRKLIRKFLPGQVVHNLSQDLSLPTLFLLIYWGSTYLSTVQSLTNLVIDGNWISTFLFLMFEISLTRECANLAAREILRVASIIRARGYCPPKPAGQKFARYAYAERRLMSAGINEWSNVML